MPTFIIDKSEQARKKKPIQIDPNSSQDYPDGRMDGQQLAKNIATRQLQTYDQTVVTEKAQILDIKEKETSALDSFAGFFGIETKSAKEARITARYKCRIISGQQGFSVPQPESKDDNIKQLAPQYFIVPADSNLDQSLLKIGSTVIVQVNNTNTSFISQVAGTILSIDNADATIESFSSNCDFTLPKQGGEARTTILQECGVVVGGKPRKVRRASAVPPKPTGAKAVSPKSPFSGQTVTKISDLPKQTSKYPNREDGVTPHKGVDFRASKGTPIVACLDGVAFLGQDSRDPERQGYGYYVVVKHTAYETTTSDNTFYTLYAHLEKDNRTSGKVSAKQQIGISSDTGSPGNPHLHFEVIYEHDPSWKTANQMTQGGATDPINNFFLNKFKKI